MGEVIERVARAIYEGSPRNKPYSLLTAFQREKLASEARSAIAAMREPTKAMLDAGTIDLGYDDDYNPAYLEKFTAGRVWEEMIDAALK